MKKHFVAISMATLGQCALAQIPISRSTNAMRSGDVLCKVKVDYVDPGKSGTEQVWQLGLVTKQSKDFIQGIASNGDTIAIFEDDRIKHYIVHGDTLYNKGEQQRRAYRLFYPERPVLHYPFQYGDSIFGHYEGAGKEENLKLKMHGFGYSVADGVGVLTDGEDSIRHITRIHLHDDFTENYGDQLSIRFQQEHYMWYCAGYRYPVMETIYRNIVENDTTNHPCDSVTYLFLPYQQMELTEDLANDSILQAIDLADAIRQANEQSQNSALSSLDASFAADGMSINISFTLDANSNITFCACDILGNMLGSSHFENREAGEWQECLTLSRKPIGNMLMLNVKCGERECNIKVYR